MNRRKFIKSIGLGFLAIPLMGFKRATELQTVDVTCKSDGIMSGGISKDLEDKLVKQINDAGDNHETYQAHYIGETEMNHNHDGINGKQLFDLTGLEGDVYVPKLCGDYVESVKVIRIKGTEWGYY